MLEINELNMLKRILCNVKNDIVMDGRYKEIHIPNLLDKIEQELKIQWKAQKPSPKED